MALLSLALFRLFLRDGGKKMRKFFFCQFCHDELLALDCNLCAPLLPKRDLWKAVGTPGEVDVASPHILGLVFAASGVVICLRIVSYIGVESSVGW